MELAKWFKFHYRDMPTEPYEAFHENGDGEVMVTWNWGNGMYETGEVAYPAKMVEQFIIDGDWIITEVANATE